MCEILRISHSKPDAGEKLYTIFEKRIACPVVSNLRYFGRLVHENFRAARGGSLGIEPYSRASVKTFMDLASIPERMAHDDILDTEYKMVDGSWHRLSFLVKKRDETGRVTHVLCAVRSISDVKRRELDLVYQADAAKREGEMKARFLSNMSHDIRTPLNGVIELPFAIGEQNAIHPEEQNFDEIPVAGIRALRECMSENDVLKLSDEL